MKDQNNNSMLPLEDLERLGLYSKGEFKLSLENKAALLAGRRTELINLYQLNIDGIHIEKLEGKLSLKHYNDGNIKLQIHPIYNEPQIHTLLNSQEAQALIAGEKHTVTKEQKISDDKTIYINIEYDEQTKEFISYDPNRLPTILQVNGTPLSKNQQEDFKNGNIIELNDGTKLQHSATDNQGVLSNNKRLILSILVDGGLTYLIFRGLKNLKGNNIEQSEGLNRNYNTALSQLITTDKIGLDNDLTIGEYIKEENNHFKKNSR